MRKWLSSRWSEWVIEHQSKGGKVRFKAVFQIGSISLAQSLGFNLVSERVTSKSFGLETIRPSIMCSCQRVNLWTCHPIILSSADPISASLLCHLHMYTVQCTGCIQNNKYRKQLMLFCYNSYSQVPRPTPRRGPCLQLIMLRSLLLVVLPSPVSVQVWPGWVGIITRYHQIMTTL